MNLKFKSTPADLYLKSIKTELDLINGNVLYITHEIDQIKKIVIEMKNSSNLQKQVDEYFEETSPQTDTVNKTDSEWSQH